MVGRTGLVVAKHQGDVDGERAASEANRHKAQEALLPHEYDDVDLQVPLILCCVSSHTPPNSGALCARSTMRNPCLARPYAWDH